MSGTGFPHEPYIAGASQRRTGGQLTFGWLPEGSSSPLNSTGFRHEPYITGASQRRTGSQITFGWMPQGISGSTPTGTTGFLQEFWMNSRLLFDPGKPYLRFGPKISGTAGPGPSVGGGPPHKPFLVTMGRLSVLHGDVTLTPPTPSGQLYWDGDELFWDDDDLTWN